MNNIRLSKSVIGEDEKVAVLSVMDKEFLGMGAEVKLFEEKLQEYIGSPVVCVSTGTAALQLALEAIDVGAGDEVLVPSLTYVASFQAISATGAKPVACDIEEQYFSLCIKDAKKRLTKKTKAIMVVHYSGVVGDFDELLEFASQNNLRVIEDAAHAFGSTHNGHVVGSFGDLTCFSFDGIKNLTSGEGGAIVTNDEEVLSRVRDARLLGVVKDSDLRFQGRRSWSFDVERQGWRYHMSNIMAAIGLAQLERFPLLERQRKALACHYLERFDIEDCEDCVEPVWKDYSTVVPHIFVVKLNGGIDRAKLRESLSDEGIETGIHYKPNHTLSYFRSNSKLPVTDRLENSILTLPLHPDLKIADVDQVVDKLLFHIRRTVP